jgi:hypothetical protein
MRPLLLVLLLIPDVASAQGFGVRMTQDGAEQLRDIALERLPPVFSTDTFDADVFDCPGERVVTGHVPPTDIHLGWHSLDLRVEDGRFYASTVISIDVATTVTIDNPYACFGEAICDVTAAVHELGVEIELAASTGPDGGVELHGATVGLALTPEDLNMESEGCAVGEVATWLFDTFEAWALELAIPRVEALMGERMSAAMKDMLDSTVGLTVERDELTIRGFIDDLSLSSSTGMTMMATAELEWTGPAMFDDPMPSVSDPSGTALPDDFEGGFQLAISDRMVNEALYEAWRGGMISGLLAERTVSIDLGSGGVVEQLGLEPGTYVDVSVDIEQPLAASFGRVAPNVASIDIRGLVIRVGVAPPTGETSHIEVHVDGTVQAGIAVDPELGGIVLDLVDLDIAEISVEAGESSITADRARLRSFIERTVTPMIAAKLAGVPLAPALHPVLGMYIDVRAIESEGGWQRVGVDIVTADPNDFSPPDAAFEDPASVVAIGTAAFRVTGSDDTTPTSLLRYRAWLDGELLNDGVASSIREVRFDAAGGEHTLEVAAIDLNDNEGAPVSHTFSVDATPPSLTILERPGAILDSRTVQLAWEASDAEGDVASGYRLSIIDADGTSRLIDEAAHEAGRFELEIGELEPGALYDLEITVRDEAGNVTSESVGFAVDPGLAGGCSAAPGGSPLPAFAILFGALGLIWKRRR